MKQLLVDVIPFEVSPQMITESLVQNNGRLIVQGVLQRADAFNQNNRSYPLGILKREADKYHNTFVRERRALGELDHPDSSTVNLSNVSHNITEMWWDGHDLCGKVEILGTPSGNILKELFKAGIKLGISSRGLGSIKEIGEGKVQVEPDFELIGFDFVSNPSTHGAFLHPLNEQKTAVVSSNRYDRVNAIITEILSEIGA